MERLLLVTAIMFGGIISVNADDTASPPKNPFYASDYAKRAAQHAGLTIEEYQAQDMERRRQRAKAAEKRRREATIARSRAVIEFSEQHMPESPEYHSKNLAKAKRMIAEAAREERLAAMAELRQAILMRPGLVAPIFPSPFLN